MTKINAWNINKQSHDLFLDAINTLPISPASGRLNLMIGSKREYEPGFLAMCEEEGIIPMSFVMWSYDAEKNRFIINPDSPGIHLGFTNSKDRIDSHHKRAKTGLEYLAKGGKMHQIIVHLDEKDGKKGFIDFKEKFLPAFLVQGYEFNDSNTLVFNKVRRGLFKNDELDFIRGVGDIPKGLTLRIFDGYLPASDVLELREWFQGLEKKYA